MATPVPHTSAPRANALSAEHETVVLRRALASAAGALPAGARGVVHDRTPDGTWYLVEFGAPHDCVVDVPGDALAR